MALSAKSSETSEASKKKKHEQKKKLVVESAYSRSKHVHGKFVTISGMLAMLILTPPIVILMWYLMVEKKGSVAETIAFFKNEGVQGIWVIWPNPTAIAWKIIFSFMGFEALLMLVVPGKECKGPVSPAGNIPIYWCNGFQAYLISIFSYLVLWRLKVIDVGLIYDHLGEIFSALNIFSLFFCLFLYFKGRYSPSSSDFGSSKNFIQDYFWGMELYPRIGKYFDIKTFTNCRFGMMSWAILIITYAIKQYELYDKVYDSMLVSVGLMLVYITKFFYWESGYWSTMDIMHDRAGYYLCWGCMVWVPCIYTSPSMYLVHNTKTLGFFLSSVIFGLGCLCVWINYDTDRQKQVFRATGGKTLIWGKPPSKVEAKYVTEKGEAKTSLLLASGWWGLSRHFHYLPEISASFFWTLPGLFDNGIQYFYVIYLTLLLFDRAIRDDERCRLKYGKYWGLYCKKVPYKIIPGIY